MHYDQYLVTEGKKLTGAVKTAPTKLAQKNQNATFISSCVLLDRQHRNAR